MKKKSTRKKKSMRKTVAADRFTIIVGISEKTWEEQRSLRKTPVGLLGLIIEVILETVVLNESPPRPVVHRLLKPREGLFTALFGKLIACFKGLRAVVVRGAVAEHNMPPCPAVGQVSLTRDFFRGLQQRDVSEEIKKARREGGAHWLFDPRISHRKALVHLGGL